MFKVNGAMGKGWREEERKRKEGERSILWIGAIDFCGVHNTPLFDGHFPEIDLSSILFDVHFLIVDCP